MFEQLTSARAQNGINIFLLLDLVDEYGRRAPQTHEVFIQNEINQPIEDQCTSKIPAGWKY